MTVSEETGPFTTGWHCHILHNALLSSDWRQSWQWCACQACQSEDWCVGIKNACKVCQSGKGGEDCGGFQGQLSFFFYQSPATWRTNLGLERPLPKSNTIYRKDRILIIWHSGPKVILKCTVYGKIYWFSNTEESLSSQINHLELFLQW